MNVNKFNKDAQSMAYLQAPRAGGITVRQKRKLSMRMNFKNFNRSTTEGRLTVVEKKSTGKVPFKIYKDYFKSGGTCFFAFCVFLFFLA